jgi:hypothetical protein
MSITWDEPSDYLEFPENYLGFLVVRTNGPTAANSYDYTANPSMQVVYVGRGNKVGDPSGVTLTSELLYSDAGLVPNLYYSYSVFSIGENFQYSNAAKVENVLLTEIFETIWYTNFNDCTIDVANQTIDFGNDIWTITSNVGSVSNVSIGVSHDPLYYSHEQKNFISLGGVKWINGSNDKSVVITSPPISLLGEGKLSLSLTPFTM